MKLSQIELLLTSLKSEVTLVHKVRRQPSQAFAASLTSSARSQPLRLYRRSIDAVQKLSDLFISLAIIREKIPREETVSAVLDQRKSIVSHGACATWRVHLTLSRASVRSLPCSSTSLPRRTPGALVSRSRSSSHLPARPCTRGRRRHSSAYGRHASAHVPTQVPAHRASRSVSDSRTREGQGRRRWRDRSWRPGSARRPGDPSAVTNSSIT